MSRGAIKSSCVVVIALDISAVFRTLGEKSRFNHRMTFWPHEGHHPRMRGSVQAASCGEDDRASWWSYHPCEDLILATGEARTVKLMNDSFR